MKVIVLGAGVVGVTSAWYLSQAGCEVLVLERQASAGLETSFANGGQVAASSAEPWSNPTVPWKIIKWLGKHDAPLRFRLQKDLRQWRWALQFLIECLPQRTRRNTENLLRLGLYSRAMLGELRAQTGVRYDALEKGILQFFTEQKELDQAAEVAHNMEQLGADRRILTVDEIVQIEPAMASCRRLLRGGVYTPHDESGDAYLFTHSLSHHVAASGVQFRFGCDIQRLVRNGERISGVDIINTEREHETMAADRYVVSMGSYSPLLLSGVGIRSLIYPVKGYSATISTEGHHGAPHVSLTDESHKLVFSRLGKRLRVAGMAELTGYNTDLDRVRCDALINRAFELWPDAGDPEPVDRWTGLRPATPGNLPLIGGTRYPNLFLNTGHGTLGWTLSCGSGKLLADIVTGRRPEIDFP